MKRPPGGKRTPAELLSQGGLVIPPMASHQPASEGLDSLQFVNGDLVLWVPDA